MPTDSIRKRVAILGTGFGTQVTAPALRAEDWDIRALFSRRPERAQEIADKLDIPHHTSDPDDIVARDDIDAVVVSTATGSTGYALSAGAQIFFPQTLLMPQPVPHLPFRKPQLLSVQRRGVLVHSVRKTSYSHPSPES